MGLAGLARVVHALAADGADVDRAVRYADDFVHVLLGIASLGDAIEALAGDPSAPTKRPRQRSADSPTRRWLR